jgi:hypothetical protein
MKTIDTRSLLLGVLAAGLVLTLTSSKSSESSNLSFAGYQYGFGLFNKTTNTFYIYKQSMPGSMPERPSYVYKVADDGSSLTKQE